MLYAQEPSRARPEAIVRGRLCRPFSRDAASGSSRSRPGRSRQGLQQRGHGPVSLDPAELALGSQQARHAPPPPHVAVTPAGHARDPPRHASLRPTSIGLVVAGVRRSARGTPSRTTVSVSSNPSRRLEAASALIRSSQRAVASCDALAAS